MWCRSYRDHAILAFPSYDTATRRWICQANITWVSGSRRESTFLRFPERVASEAESIAASLKSAQAWIDKQANSGSMPRQPAPAVAESESSRRGARPPVSSDRGGKPRAGALTFEQFKSLVQSCGHQGSEDSLHKSYAALLELRKTRHASWAAIEPKLRQLEDRAMHSPSTAEGVLPLTPGDWRRIV